MSIFRNKKPARPDNFIYEEEFRMVTAQTHLKFQNKVNKLLKEGWSILGEPIVKGGSFHQALFKHRLIRRDDE